MAKPLDVVAELRRTESPGTSELETVREEGIGVADGDFQPGLHGVAAPILDNDDRVHGAVSIRGPKRSIQNDWTRANLRDELFSATNTIEVNLMIFS